MDIYDLFKVSREEAKWRDLSLCKKMGYIHFYESYETDPHHARAIDEQCLDCPVIKNCGLYAESNKQQGCWGGIYWGENGLPDEVRNRHKTADVWRRLEEIYGRDFGAYYESGMAD